MREERRYLTSAVLGAQEVCALVQHLHTDLPVCMGSDASRGSSLSCSNAKYVEHVSDKNQSVGTSESGPRFPSPGGQADGALHQKTADP